MIIAYRTPAIEGGWHGNRELRRGEIKRVKPGTPRASNLRPPRHPSERDWMVPNLRDPYGQAAAL